MNIMNNRSKIYDEQADTIRIEDITTDINNRIVLRRLKNNKYGKEGEANHYLWIQNRHDQEDGFETSTDYVPGGSFDMGWLGYFVGKSNVLRHLSIRNGSSLEPFLIGVNHNKSITTLCFNGVNLLEGRSFMMILDSFFKNNHNLTEITVNNCLLGNDCCRLLALAIGGRSRSLGCLIMKGNNNITEEDMVPIITSLSMHPQLKRLELQGGVIHKNGCVALATLLQNSTTGLQTLDLSQNDIDDIGIDILVPALAKHRRLQRLVISRNDSVTTRGWQSLATILENPDSNLQELIVFADNIDDETLCIFINALSNNCTLQVLYLGASDISKDTLQGFSNLLCDTLSVNATYLSNHTLTSLDNMIQCALKPLLTPNQKGDKKKVATLKVLKHHNDFDMKPFFEWEFKVLPLVIGWLERAFSYTTDFDANIEERKLSSIYQFIRNMPVLYVETRLRNELEDILSEVSQMEEEERERKLRKQLLQERKKTIMEKLDVGK